MIAVGEKGGVKSGYVGFPLLKTEFPLRVAFPIFFNNMVWAGLQTSAFVYRNPDTGKPQWADPGRAPLPEKDRMALAHRERQLRDDQEEYWRAYKILNGIVEQAGPTPLRRRAAASAVSCLRRINTDRFGRAREIHDADIRLSRWLVRHSNQ